MAQIVSIDTGTLRTGINEIGDIVAIHEDDAELSGSGYSNLKVTKISGITLSELNIAISTKIPKQNRAFRATVITWTLTLPEEKGVWRDIDGKWRFLEKPPKYALTIEDLSAQDITDLSSGAKTKTQKLMILDKVKEKISLDSLNQIEAADLNI